METLVKNSATVASIYEAFGRGDIAFIISQLDNDVIWVAMGNNPTSGTYNGSKEVPAFFTGLASNYQIENFQVNYILDADDSTVIAKGYQEGKGLRSGKPLRTHWAMEWKFNEDGKVVEYRNIYDTLAYSNAL